MGEVLDIAVIGAGAAGLSAAVNALARGKSVRVFSNRGNYLARAERVDNYLGFYQVNGQELMDSFRKHAESMGIAVELGKVVNILPFDGYFMVNFNGEIITVKTVIIAVGVAKHRLLTGEEKLLGRGVSYCATCDGMLYRGRRVVVYGQADDIVEEANFLQGIGAGVVFVSPQPQPAQLDAAIRFVSGRVQSIEGESAVQSVVVDGARLETDAVFVLRNALAPTALVDGLATEDGFISVNRKMETNLSGLFACGDCVGVPLQVAKAVGEGLIAAQQAAKYIDENSK